MGMKSALEAVQALIRAYYIDRDLTRTLACVTEDIQWVGTERHDAVKGKEELYTLLVEDIDAFPDTFGVEVEQVSMQKLSDSVEMLTIFGRQAEIPGVISALSVRGTVCCVKGADGWLVSGVHTSVPNAEREKYLLERELVETRKKEQALMAGIPGGVAIYRLKKNGAVQADYISDGLGRMCGYDTGEEFLSRLHQDSRVNMVPEDEELVRQAVLDSIAKRAPVSVVYHIYTKDGGVMLNRMDANVITENYLDEDDLAILCAVHTRVSAESQRAMKEQEHYRIILNMMGIAYFEWDGESGFYISEKFTEYALSEGGFGAIIGDGTGMDSIHPEDSDALRQYLSEKVRPKDRPSVIVRMKMKDGSYRWTEVFGYAEYSAEGRISRLIGVMRDVDKTWIDQHERLQAALNAAQEANRAKTDFLSRVSHDMRTPLNGILGLTALVKDAVADERIQRDMAQLELSGQYLLNLINDTLDVSRIESGKLELHPVVCDGRTVFNNVIALTRAGLEAKNIQFQIHAENLPFTMLYIDVGRVEQIVMNILGNAVKFTPEGGAIYVTMENLMVEEGVITDVLTIRDTGIGMSPSFIPRLFEPFSQENSSTKNPNQGTGLGMTITKQLVELMGGSLSVESELGKGTCVAITLPLPIATEAQIEEWKNQKHPRGDQETLRDKRVLLCEDHPLNTQIAIRLLEQKGMLVEHAENGRVGVEMFRQSSLGYYDVVLMDIRMPVMDGMEATRAIRALPREDVRTVPIIAMTANAFADDVERTRVAGMDAHLSKPIETTKLYQTLQDLLKVERHYRRQKVLIVDDVAVNRAVIRASIEQDYDVYEAESGEEALEVLARQRGIDVVVTDIQMPRMDGVELTRRIRANPDYRYMAIIASTQYGDAKQEELLLALGANDFVYKPTTPKSVGMRIRNVLKKM